MIQRVSVLLDRPQIDEIVEAIHRQLLRNEEAKLTVWGPFLLPSQVHKLEDSIRALSSAQSVEQERAA